MATLLIALLSTLAAATFAATPLTALRTEQRAPQRSSHTQIHTHGHATHEAHGTLQASTTAAGARQQRPRPLDDGPGSGGGGTRDSTAAFREPAQPSATTPHQQRGAAAEACYTRLRCEREGRLVAAADGAASGQAGEGGRHEGAYPEAVEGEPEATPPRADWTASGKLCAALKLCGSRPGELPREAAGNRRGAVVEASQPPLPFPTPLRHTSPPHIDPRKRRRRRATIPRRRRLILRYTATAWALITRRRA